MTPTSAATWRARVPGLFLVAAATAMSLRVSVAVPVVSSLILAIVLGVVVRNVGALPPRVAVGTRWATKRLLRAGVVLLGLQLSVPEVLALRPGELVTILVTVVVTFLGTRWVGAQIGASRALSLLVATGFAICGASAVAAMSAVIRPDGANGKATGGGTTAEETTEDDVATAIAMVTLFGAVTLFALPLAQGAAGLDDHQMGVWIGASVHEVAQVVAAASAVSTAALTVAVVVKLGRVVLLAPLVAAVGALERRRAVVGDVAGGTGDGSRTSRPPVVPLFVVGFLAMVVVRSVGLLPAAVLDAAAIATTLLLAGAMFGLGTGVHVATLARTGGRALALGAASTTIAVTVSLAGIRLLT
ncbi:putative sulfate exporter family transporter [Cellulomonas fimi]|uniref:YeiH family protein n=1 Tax=Cellulomonas fimi TaxID=1708 RepID=UPI001B85BFA1|nr:putative sulfate exporter family transporter [Cellulomonas fimi]